MNLKFELNSNFKVRKLDISKLNKYRVELDYYKNQAQIDTALAFCKTWQRNWANLHCCRKPFLFLLAILN